MLTSTTLRIQTVWMGHFLHALLDHPRHFGNSSVPLRQSSEQYVIIVPISDRLCCFVAFSPGKRSTIRRTGDPLTPTVTRETTQNIHAYGPAPAKVSPRENEGIAPKQDPSRVILVRPHQFTPNPLTETDNRFQSTPSGDPDQVAQAAFDEVTNLERTLQRLGVGVAVFEDATVETPDSVFPNNWFSTHDDGTVVIYPMHAPNRRAERREDILSHLNRSGVVTRVIDYSSAETDRMYLEGTGAMVLDHVHRIAYVCRSHRASQPILDKFCADLGFRALVFDAVDSFNSPVYHTNVLMSVGTDVAVIGAEMIRDENQRAEVLETLRSTGREVVELQESQIQEFAGNCLEVAGADGPTMVMSTTAEKALTANQLSRMSRHVGIESVDVSTIESAGGSVRCMIAGNHLAPRSL